MAIMSLAALLAALAKAQARKQVVGRDSRPMSHLATELNYQARKHEKRETGIVLVATREHGGASRQCSVATRNSDRDSRLATLIATRDARTVFRCSLRDFAVI